MVAFVLAALVFACVRTWADPDLWGHLRFGQDLWDTGRVARGDPYSYLTGDRPWINHEWLAEAIFARVFSALGAPGLIALKTLLSLSVAGLLYRRLMRHGLDALAAGLVLTAFTVLVVPGVTTVRPQVWSYVLFALLLFLVEAAEAGAAAPLVLVPLLFALWANLHGAFLVGLGTYLVWGAAHLLDALAARGPAPSARSARPWPVLASMGAACAATLLNPYGLDLWRSLGSATDRRLELVEWNPLVLPSLLGAVYLIALGVAIAAMLGSRLPRPRPLAAVFACAALLPLVAVRHTPFFAIAALFVSAPHIAPAFGRWWAGRWGTPVAGGRFRPVVAAALGAGALGLLGLSAPYVRCIAVEPAEYPVRAVALLRQHAASGDMAVFLEWGDYALWHLGPRVKVSGDTRREMVYSDPAYRANLRFAHGTGDWDAVLRRGDASLALVSKRFPTFNLMALEPAWRLVSEDDTSALFARRGSSADARLPAAAPRAETSHDRPGCFP